MRRLTLPIALLLALLGARSADARPAPAAPARPAAPAAPARPSAPTAPAQPAPAPAIGKLEGGFIALSVADGPATARWYQDVLGFTVTTQGTPNEKVAYVALLRSGGTILEIIQRRDARPRRGLVPDLKDPSQIQGIFKTGFHVPDLDALFRAVRERGAAVIIAPVRPKDQPLRTFIIQDNEGNWLQFFGA